VAQRILIVDDEKRAVDALSRFFRGKGYDVLHAHDGSSGLAIATETVPDAIITDIKMPDMDGFTLCRLIKKGQRTGHIPVIIISGHAIDDQSQVAGLEGGADDYVLKPISPNVLLARLRTVLRRPRPDKEAAHLLKGAGITVDCERHSVRAGNKAVTLTPKEFKLLALLMDAHGRVIGQQKLLDEVWSDIAPEVRDLRTLEVHISRLRKKLGKEAATALRKVTGVGYQFDA
jgi:DNA-binding response OmpR family regulator